MALAPKTVLTYPLDGANRDFQIPFEYLARKFVQVTLIGSDRNTLTLNIDYRFTQRTVITTTKAWGQADGYDRIEIRRFTSATERLVDFSDGSILRAYDLNTSTVQSLHIAEEGRDIATDTIGVDNDGHLDARGRNIRNVAVAVLPGDAVPLRQLQEYDGSALNSALAAQDSENAAKASENAAKASENASKSSENAAKASATAAAGSATAAKASETAAKAAENSAETHDANAKAYAQAAREAADETLRFLPPNPVHHTTREEGSPLQVGDRYLNTTVPALEYIYKGGQWVANNVDGQALAGAGGTELVGWNPKFPGTVTLPLTDAILAVYFENFGPVVGDATATMQKAFNSGATVIMTRPGVTYTHGELTVPTDNLTLMLTGGSTLRFTGTRKKGITWNGKGGSIVGSGTIKGNAGEFDGVNERTTYALVWVNGDGFKANGFNIDTIPRCGLYFENCTHHVVEGLRINGRYPHAQYDEHITTAHFGVIYDAPPVSQYPDNSFVYRNNYTRECIQGFGPVNLGAEAINTAVIIDNCFFYHCWDHGIYTSRLVSVRITNITFHECRRPFVLDTKIGLVSNILCYSPGGTETYHEQLCGIRETSDCQVSNVVIYGPDAGLFADCLETQDSSRLTLSNIKIHSLGSRYASAGMRVGVGSASPESLTISDVVLTGVFRAGEPAVLATVLAGTFGRSLSIRNVTIDRSTPGDGIEMHRYTDAVVSDVMFAAQGEGSGDCAAVRITYCAYPSVSDVRATFRSGLNGMTVSGINVDSNSVGPNIRDVVVRNASSATSAKAVRSPIWYSGSGNLNSITVDPRGTFTVPVGASTLAVNNVNINDGSAVSIYAVNPGGAALIRECGLFFEVGDGSIKVKLPIAATREGGFAYAVL